MKPAKPDGVYADAHWHNLKARLGVVRIVDGAVVETHSRELLLPSSNAAEAAAILWAYELYPSLPVFSDCNSAAKMMGAKWIPRESNGAAHKVAAGTKSITSEDLKHVTPRAARMSRLPSSRKRRGGRGVVPATSTLPLPESLLAGRAYLRAGYTATSSA